MYDNPTANNTTDFTIFNIPKTAAISACFLSSHFARSCYVQNSFNEDKSPKYVQTIS